MFAKLALGLSLIFSSVSCALAGDELPESDTVYLFSSFRNDGETGLHLAWSEDGLDWHDINEGASVLPPLVGGRLMRDPCIILGGDGRYHMVWTTGWWEDNIAIAHSDDLITWSEQTELPVMRGTDGVMNSWAPEIFYDEEEGESAATPDGNVR